MSPPPRPARALALSPIAADALDIIAELTERDAPPSLGELSDELDAGDEETRSALLAIRDFVEPLHTPGGATRWRSLLRVRRRPELEFVRTFSAPHLAAKL